MRQLVGLVLVGGLLASCGATSRGGPASVGPDSTTHTSAATVEAHTATAVEPLPARITILAPATTHRSIQGFQVPTHAPLPPATAEPLAGLSSGSSCPPSGSDLPCRAPY